MYVHNLFAGSLAEFDEVGFGRIATAFGFDSMVTEYDELDPDSDFWDYPNAFEFVCAEWKPEPPEEGWALAAKFIDSEGAIVACWVKPRHDLAAALWSTAAQYTYHAEDESYRRAESFDFNFRTPGIDAVQCERARQVQGLGYTVKTDATIYRAGTLTAAAVGYAEEAQRILQGKPVGAFAIGKRHGPPPFGWPFSPSAWRPSPDPIRNLQKAAALLVAEIDRETYAREQRKERRVLPALTTNDKRDESPNDVDRPAEGADGDAGGLPADAGN